MSGAPARRDPARFSDYVDDAFYARLVEVAKAFTDPGEPPAEPLRAACERLLVREARLVDDRRFDDWLALFARELVYWIPSTPGGGDPRLEVSLELHDRRRLEDRMARLATGKAWSQIPPTRTRHLLTNVEVWAASASELRARANLLLETFHAGLRRSLAGWCGWVVVLEDGAWRIALKQVNLIDSDYGQENNTFLL